MRKGKSTVAVYLGKEIFNIKKELGKTRPDDTFTLKNIAADQREGMIKRDDERFSYTVLVIDEHSELEAGGVNSSAEKSLQIDQSNIQAAQYVDTIMCTPRRLMDENTDIIIEVIDKDIKTKTNVAYLSYRYTPPGTEVAHIQPIGYLLFDVGDLLEQYLKHVEPYEHYWVQEKQIPANIKERVKKIAKQDLYTAYYIRKLEKHRIIKQENIKRFRVLTNAEVYIELFERFKFFYKTRGFEGLLKHSIEQSFAQKGLPTSIIMIQEALEDMKGLLNLHVAKKQFTDEMSAIKQKKNLSLHEKKLILTELKKSLHEIKKELQYQLNTYNRAIKINEEYNNVT